MASNFDWYPLYNHRTILTSFVSMVIGNCLSLVVKIWTCTFSIRTTSQWMLSTAASYILWNAYSVVQTNNSCKGILPTGKLDLVSPCFLFPASKFSRCKVNESMQWKWLSDLSISVILHWQQSKIFRLGIPRIIYKSSSLIIAWYHSSCLVFQSSATCL